MKSIFSKLVSLFSLPVMESSIINNMSIECNSFSGLESSTFITSEKIQKQALRSKLIDSSVNGFLGSPLPACSISLDDLNDRIKEVSEIKNEINIESFQKLTEQLAERETEILRDKNRWESTFNSIPDLVMIVNEDRTIIRVNASLCAATKRNPEDFLGKKCHDILSGSNHKCTFCPPPNDKKVTKCFENHMNNIETIVIDNPYLKGTFLFSSTRILYEELNQNSSVVILRDISKIKETEINLKKKKKR